MPAAASSPAAQTVVLLLADSRLPSGGHVSSSGLEPALMGGLRREEVLDYLLVRARTVALIDAACAVVVHHTLIQETDPTAALARAERAWAARTPSGAARQIAAELGRGLLRLAKSLWSDAPVFQLLEASTFQAAPSRPAVIGAIAFHAGIDAEELVRLVIYDDAAAAAAALLKLDPGDPAEAMRLVLEACASVEDQVPQVAGLTDPDEMPAASAPQMEDWIERHAHTTRRLFRA